MGASESPEPYPPVTPLGVCHERVDPRVGEGMVVVVVPEQRLDMLRQTVAQVLDRMAQVIDRLRLVMFAPNGRGRVLGPLRVPPAQLSRCGEHPLLDAVHLRRQSGPLLAELAAVARLVFEELLPELGDGLLVVGVLLEGRRRLAHEQRDDRDVHHHQTCAQQLVGDVKHVVRLGQHQERPGVGQHGLVEAEELQRVGRLALERDHLAERDAREGRQGAPDARADHRPLDERQNSDQHDAPATKGRAVGGLSSGVG